MGPRSMPLALFCRGDDFADALSVSPHAYAWGCPIILTPTNRLDPAALRAWIYLSEHGYLKLRDFPDVAPNWKSMLYAVVGGTSAISASTQNAIFEDGFAAGAYYQMSAIRLAGGSLDYPSYKSDRYGTGRAVNEYFATFSGSYDAIAVASGMNFPDALAGGPAMGARGGTLVLMPPNRTNADSYAVIAEYGPYILDAQVFGSSASISNVVLASVRTALGTSLYDINSPTHRIAPTAALRGAQRMR
jgi:hypothetical protein